MTTESELREEIEKAHREDFEAGLEASAQEQLDITRDEREAALAEELEEILRADFEDAIEEIVDRDLERMMETA